jgi:integrase
LSKGSVRKKGKKWYYRFYVEDASGKMVQKEYAGTESKSETEKLLRKALEDYLGAIRCIKKHPIAERKLKTVTAEHLQAFLDLLTFGGEFPDGKVRKGYSKDYIHSFSAVLQQSFR